MNTIAFFVLTVLSFIAAIYLGTREVKPSLVKTRDFWTQILIIVGFLNFIGFCLYGL